VARVHAALAAVDHALERLGSKTGDRADAARKLLSQRRAHLASALVAIEQVCGPSPATRTQFAPGGPEWQTLEARFVAACAGIDAAREAFKLAKPADVKKARDALDVAEAAAREIDRECDSLQDAIAYPNLRDLDIEPLLAAEQQTAALTNAAKVKSAPARALEMALTQAVQASPEVAALFICFEPSGAEVDRSHPVFWRTQRRAEGV